MISDPLMRLILLEQYLIKGKRCNKTLLNEKIMWGDLDALGIVFYPRYYEWFDACGHLFFEKINLNIGELWSERKILFGLAETSCRYLKPSKISPINPNCYEN